MDGEITYSRPYNKHWSLYIFISPLPNRHVSEKVSLLHGTWLIITLFQACDEIRSAYVLVK
jgi:hypothetical protein